MRAVVVSGTDLQGHVHIEDMPMPPCGPNDVIIKVAAAGVNPVDWKECEGHLASFFAYPEKWIPGLDGAGVVHQTGSAVSEFKVGDRVVTFSDRGRGHNGTFAQYVRVLDELVAIVPPTVTLEAAASVPTAGVTGYQALFRSGKGDLHEGDTVFIHGGSGGMGSFCVQFAKAKGLRVAASCSAKNVDYVLGLGADLVIDHRAGHVVGAVRQWAPDGVDVVLDCVSGGTLPDALDALRPGGRLIRIPTLTQDGDTRLEIEQAAQRGFTMVFAFVEYDRVGPDLAEIVDLMATGGMAPPLITSFPFERACDAMQAVKDGGVHGKIVLTIDG